MPNLISIGCKLPGILDVLSHQVGVNVWGQVVEKESLEHETFGFVDSMIQGELAAHLAHQGGQLHSLVPLKGVQGMELCEALLEGFIRAILRGILNKIDNLGRTYTAGQAPDSKLGLCLSKPNLSLICPELWKLQCFSVDVEGDSSLGSRDSLDILKTGSCLLIENIVYCRN